ncbi:hypothetical protein JMJ35_010226 [Cladonia borealis]|uniref:Monooxygenase n=1 Tax=Cladonia borealis TaxID=184061 RepID=A0AA39QT12_9LECA|nr:hypothetical protein JMJ35_010226 [Cladonia borealis]
MSLPEPFIKNNFHLTTWLAAGACIQSILVLVLPRHVALLPAIIYLLVKIINGALITKGYTRNPYLPTPYLKRMTAPIPEADGTLPAKGGEKGVVVFIVGANYNHPLGLFAPGFKQVADYFGNMWKEASSDRERWGFLGKSDAMILPTPGGGNALVTMSYWKSIEHLHAFAQGPSHKLGWDWWSMTNKQWPHIGIMHETYAVPAGSWENIYQNHHPIGMAQTKYVINDKESGEKKLVSSFMEAKGGKWKSMLLRMDGEREDV